MFKKILVALNKLDVSLQALEEAIETHLQEALRHSRIISEPDPQAAQESAIAWDVVKKYG